MPEKELLHFQNGVFVQAFAAVGSKAESAGPLGPCFDYLYKDPTAGQKSWEQAESALQKKALTLALKKGNIPPNDLDMIFAGDLINQCTVSSFGLKDFFRPYVGMYGACSTMALTLLTAAQFVAAGSCRQTASVTSSHFCTAQRQYRYPLEYGGQRPPTAQWTATAAGAVILGSGPKKVQVCSALVGTVTDYGVTDQNNMGAAMAPAAANTLLRYFKLSGTTPENYDAIFTGDLGAVGSTLLYQLLQEQKIDITARHKDCGLMLFDRNRQDVHAGGSGCGCSASVLCGHILKELEQGNLKNVLFCATGALLSPVTVAQKQSVPCIAHLVQLKAL